jgi:hypothetical protein
MVIVAMAAGAGCGGETLGALQVTIRLETPTGLSRSCDDFAADLLELVFYAEPGDLVPHDVATVDCGATAAGRATFGLAVTARLYHRVVLRFITSAGDTARVCGPEGRVDAVLEQTDVQVTAGVLVKLDYVLVGESLPCAAQETL